MSWESGHRDNQTKAHARLMQMAMTRFANQASLRGVRMAEEVSVGKAVLDVLALFYPQGRHWDRLTEGEPKPEPRKERIPGFDSELWTRTEVERPPYGWAAFVIEAKATRTDFRRFSDDVAYRMAREVGNFHYLAAEPGIYAAEEIPETWGILERRGRGLRELRRPKYVRLPAEKQAALAEIMLWIRRNWHRQMVIPRAAIGKVWDALMGVT